jgi:hypothetical protein
LIDLTTSNRLHEKWGRLLFCDLHLQKYALRSYKYKLCDTIQALSQITFDARPTCAPYVVDQFLNAQLQMESAL